MKKLGKLSETELEVMEVVWQETPSVTVAELLDHFAEKNWKTSTVSTLLKRLIEKGYVTKTLVGKVNHYQPAITLGQYKKMETETFLNRLYNGKAKNFITALVDNDKLSQEDIAELKVWFDRKDDER